ncbi:DUF4747 family protein [Burkholderia pseudomallei]|uniref:DUF4747 family protein n=1 Tax=Burkholderia pseudomallei TaxID=28450 RepID=UPI0005372A05|nr:DUF4747 family protein [Burkholderia pseudomallei]KGW92034.1 hypothetical protein Y048_4559 [Burkholderia pseudomallei MSHR456]
MARPKKLPMGIVNITLHPHSPERYVDLFTKLFSLDVMADAAMNHKMFLGRVSSITEGKPLDGIAGEFYRFFNLDKRSAWISTATRTALKRTEANRVKDIPDDLKPDASSFQFVFYPKQHRLVYTLRGQYFENSLVNPRTPPTMSPNSLVAVLNQLFADPKIIDEFGRVEVTAEPRKEKLEEMLGLKRMQHFRIELTRPNPDDHDALERRYLKKLDDQNVRQQVIELRAATGSGIKLDDDMKQAARVAASNGKVEVEGYNEQDKKVYESTEEHPYTDTISYNPKLQQPVQVLAERALEFVRRVIGGS